MMETHSSQDESIPDMATKPPTSQILSHSLSASDPDNPMNWPLHRRTYASAVSWAFAFAVAFGLTVYTAGINDVVAEFNVSTTIAILGFSLYLWGIAFAPIYTPHVAERYGRSVVYFASLFVHMLFILGAGWSRSFASLAVCRFFAGLSGGPCLVLIEGTFADVWSAGTTNTYYAVLGLASYVGAACGPLIGGFIVGATGWRWTQWVSLMVSLAAFLLGIGVPETYQREIPRRRAERLGRAYEETPAQSGVTISQMARITVLSPLKMLVTEPVVIMCSLYLGFNFAIIFQWFITVPAVLNLVYGFTIQQAGLAFIGAIVGSLCAAAMSVVIEQILYRLHDRNKPHINSMDIEYRLIPAMIGGFGITASLFWIGWTAKPTIGWPSPVIGTAVYVWGNYSVLISLVSYLFDAYPPAGTLSALTAAASLRLVLAGLIPLVILQMFTGLTGAWALSLFGFIAAAMLPIPFILFKWGPKLRARSKYTHRQSTMDDQHHEAEHTMGEQNRMSV